MLINKYDRFADIPGSEYFSEIIPIFATQNYADFLKAIKKHNTVWFACLENDKVSYLLPFAIIKKIIFKKGYFTTGVISFAQDNSLEKEKNFVESIIIYIKKNKLCDWIQQGPNWALFNTVPSGSKAVKYGTFKISFKDKNENDLYSSIYNVERRSMRKALNDYVEIKKGADYLNDCLEVINNTASKANLDVFKINDARKLLQYFGENLKIYVSYKENIPQTAAIYLCNKYCTYAYYAGSIIKAYRGSNVFLYWEAIKDAKIYGCDQFDFTGARVNPPHGSKLERISRFKEHFGSEFVQGYLWKMNFSLIKYYIYRILIRLMYLVKFKKYKPDIIDQELKRLEKTQQ